MQQLTNLSYGVGKANAVSQQFGVDEPLAKVRTDKEVVELLEKAEAICDEGEINEIDLAFDNLLLKAHGGKLDTSHLVLKDVYVTGRGNQKRWVDPNKGNKEYAPHGSEVTFKQSGKDMKGVVGDTKYLSKPNTHLYEIHGEDGKKYQKFVHHISEVHGKADKSKYGGLTRGSERPVIGTDPKSKDEEPKGTFYHDINKRFQVYEDLADEVINGHSIRSLLVYGSGGVGKSYTVSKILGDSKKKAYKSQDTTPKGSDKYDYVALKGGSLTTAGLYKALWEHNGKLIILDDNDSVLRDPNATNMLKGALDTKDRRVSKGSARPIKDDDGLDIPDTFPFRGKFIFITNLDVNEPSLQPLKTRSSKIDMTMSPDQTIDRIEEIGKDKKSGKLTGFDFADDEGEKGDFKYTHDDAKYVMDFMRKRKNDFGDDLSIRTVKTLLTLKKRAEKRGVDPSDYMETHILSKMQEDRLNNSLNRFIS